MQNQQEQSNKGLRDIYFGNFIYLKIPATYPEKDYDALVFTEHSRYAVFGSHSFIDREDVTGRYELGYQAWKLNGWWNCSKQSAEGEERTRIVAIPISPSPSSDPSKGEVVGGEGKSAEGQKWQAEDEAIKAGYPQSDKEHFETTYWTQHNIYVEGFLKAMHLYKTQPSGKAVSEPQAQESVEGVPVICLNCKSIYAVEPKSCDVCGHKTFQPTHPSNVLTSSHSPSVGEVVYVPVKCSDRLPDEDGSYGVVVESGGIMIDRKIFLKGSGWFYPTLERMPDYFVTHWLERRPHSEQTGAKYTRQQMERAWEAFRMRGFPHNTDSHGNETFDDFLTSLNHTAKD